MKKALILVLALIFLTGAGLIWRNFKVGPAMNKISDSIPSEDNQKQELSPENSQPKDSLGEGDFQSRALKIISKPVSMKPQLSEEAKNKILAKIEELKNEIRKDYDSVSLWYDLGTYLRSSGDFQGAIDAWNFAVLIRPKDFVAYNNLGDLYGFYLHDYDKSELYFLKSLENNPSNINAYLQLATVYEAAKMIKEKENILLLGVKNNPENVSLLIYLSRFYNEFLNNKEKALEYLEEALKYEPDNSAIQEEILQLKA